MASNGDALLLYIWVVLGTPSLPLLPGPLWSWVVVPVIVPSVNEIDVFKNCSYSKDSV